MADSVAVEPTTGAAAYSTSDGGVIAFRTPVAPSSRLTWFDRSGRQLGAFGSTEQAGAINPGLSPDDRRVAANRTLVVSGKMQKDSMPSCWTSDAAVENRRASSR